MNDLDVDMDELETRLYGQVYHITNIEEDFTPTCQIGNDIPVKTFPRYFKDHTSKPQNNTFYERMGLFPISVINPPINNIVVLPSPPTQIFNRPQENSDKWLDKILQRYENSRLKNKQKKLRKKLRQKERYKELQEKRKLEKMNEIEIKKTEEIVNQDDNVTTVKDESVVIVDDSDSNTSDVILVETTSDVITIDCEEVQSNVHNVINETTSNDCFKVNLSEKDGLSPLIRKDTFDISSSNSSTIDYTETFHGTKIFNEVSTRSSNSFSELNLDSFTTYMEHNGNTSKEIPTHSKSVLEKNGHSERFEKYAIENSSDSSSESEYDACEPISDISRSTYNVLTPTKRRTIDSGKVKNNANALTINREELKECVKKSSKFKKIKLDMVDTQKKQELSVIEVDATTSNDSGDNVMFLDENSTSSAELSLKESDQEVVNSTKILNIETGDINYPVKDQENRPKKFMDYWTDDMDKFYKESWGHESFNIAEQQRQMSDNPNMWKIIPTDMVNSNFFTKQPRCRRCHEFGHITGKCTEILQPPKCILCGATGHSEARCPDKLCTSCGFKNSYFTTYCSSCARTRHIICSICKMKGHLFQNCPDLWRRYLFTTAEGAVVSQPDEANLKQAKDRWCSGCAGNGHFEQSCNYYNRTHLPASVRIYDYTDVYSGQTSRRSSQMPPPLLEQRDSETENSNTNSTVSKNSFSWELTWKEQKRLLQHGSAFLKTIEKLLKVKVKIIGRKCRIIGGSTSIKLLTKDVINRFCMNGNVLKQMNAQNFYFKITPCSKKNLKINLNFLQNSTVDWRNLCNGIYNIIRENRTQDRIKELYKKLNGIINAKLKLGDAENHMKTLKRCLKGNREVVEESFQYIFNNGDELSENYENLIEQLPSTGYHLDDSNHLEIEKLKKAVLDVCNRSNAEMIEKLYTIIIINNYSDTSVANFKNTVSSVLSNVPESKSLRRRRRNF